MPLFIYKNQFAIYLSLIFFSFIGCKNRDNQFSNTTQQFQDSLQGTFAVCLYPSTIRMLNTNNDTAFNKLISDIKKIKIVTYNKPSNAAQTIQISSLAQKIKDEQYVDLFRLKQNDKDILVYMLKDKTVPKKFYAIISDSSQIVLVDLVGNIPLKNLSAIARGEANLSGLSSIFNITKSLTQQKNIKK